MARTKRATHSTRGESYQIFLDPETLALFGYLEIEDETRWQQLAATEINQNGGITWQNSWKQILMIRQ